MQLFLFVEGGGSPKLCITCFWYVSLLLLLLLLYSLLLFGVIVVIAVVRIIVGICIVVLIHTFASSMSFLSISTFTSPTILELVVLVVLVVVPKCLSSALCCLSPHTCSAFALAAAVTLLSLWRILWIHSIFHSDLV